jgi:hypothetical protein
MALRLLALAFSFIVSIDFARWFYYTSIQYVVDADYQLTVRPLPQQGERSCVN